MNRRHRKRQRRTRRAKNINDGLCCGVNCKDFNFCPNCGQPVDADREALRGLSRFIQRTANATESKTRSGARERLRKEQALLFQRDRMVLRIAITTDQKQKDALKVQLLSDAKAVEASIRNWKRRNGRKEYNATKWRKWADAFERTVAHSRNRQVGDC